MNCCDDDDNDNDNDERRERERESRAYRVCWLVVCSEREDREREGEGGREKTERRSGRKYLMWFVSNR